jgi:hypothetical protein
VVLPFGPTSLGISDDLPLDKAFAYAKSQFPRAWPEGYTPERFPAFSPATFAALRSSPFEQNLHFRSAPLNWLNATLRLKMRSDLRGDATTDWIRPYRMLGKVSEQTLAWHLQSLQPQLKTCSPEGDAKAVSSIRNLVASVRDADAVPVLVMLPVHPRLRADAAPLLPQLHDLLDELAEQHRGTVVGASELLNEQQFADAVHPNAEGREVYSQFMGRHLAPVLNELTSVLQAPQRD